MILKLFESRFENLFEFTKKFNLIPSKRDVEREFMINLY